MSNRYQPAMLGGLFIGILSSLPYVRGANVCCCLWVVVGGLLTTYMRQQQQPEPIETAEAILGGLIAGAIGATLTLIGNWAFDSGASAIAIDRLREQLDANPGLSPQMRDMILNFVAGRGVIFLRLAITLVVYTIFSMLGALLGLAFFKKKPTPPPPPAI